MKYDLIKANQEDIEVLKKWKIKTILEYANNLSKEEILKIEKYINENIPKQLSEYKIIHVNNKKIGCILIYKYEDGYLFDEFYLEKEYRNNGIGTNVFKKIISLNKPIYLWVYKQNKKAIKLYKRLGFKIINETDTRYFMKHCL